MKDKEINVTKCQYYNKNGKCRIPHFENGIKYVSCNCDELDCDFKQLKRKEQECEKLKKQLMQKSEVDMFFNTPIEGWSNDPCGICPHKAENEELKKELNGSEKWRIKAESLNEKLDIENTCYRKALDKIEHYFEQPCEDCYASSKCQKCIEIEILDIINKAKGGECN